MSGSFISYVHLSIDEWQPMDSELRRLSKEMVTIAEEHHLLERLVVSEDLAMEMFEGNPFKTKQIPFIAKNCPSKPIFHFSNAIVIVHVCCVLLLLTTLPYQTCKCERLHATVLKKRYEQSRESLKLLHCNFFQIICSQKK